MAEDTVLQPAHRTEVPIRVSHGSWTEEPFVSIAENTKVPNLKHVFSARTVLPPKFTDMKIPVVNLDDRSQTIVQGTKLGTIEEAKELRDADEADSSSPNLERDEDQKKSEVIEQLMKNLPEELIDEQRS